MKKTAYGSEIFSKFANVIMALSASVRLPVTCGLTAGAEQKYCNKRIYSINRYERFRT